MQSKMMPSKNHAIQDIIEALPPALAKAHAALDLAVDCCYRKEPFNTDCERVEYLFALYEKLAAPLTVAAKKPRNSRHWC